MATPETEVRLEIVALDDLVLDPANVRKHPERNLDAIRGSLRRFGQQSPIVVGFDNVVVAGNGRVEAMRAEGWTECYAIRTSLEGAERIAFAIADNRTGELAEWDDAWLAEVLSELDVDLTGAAGFTPKEVEEMLAKLDKDRADLGDDYSAPGGDEDFSVCTFVVPSGYLEEVERRLADIYDGQPEAREWEKAGVNARSCALLHVLLGGQA